MDFKHSPEESDFLVSFLSPPVYRSQPWLHPSMFLTVAGSVREAGFKVEVLDANSLGMSWENMEVYLREKHPDAIIFSPTSSFVYPCMYLAFLTKINSPSTIVIGEGPHFSAVPELSFRTCPEIDFIIGRESYRVAPELLRLCLMDDNSPFRRKPPRKFSPSFLDRLSKIPGVHYFHEGATIYTGLPEIDKDLDHYPLPPYDLVDMSNYYLPLIGGKEGVTLLSSWGCSNNPPCYFCFPSARTFWDTCWRGRSGKRLADEIDLLYKKYNKRYFWFYDNDFLWNAERLSSFIEEIKRRKIRGIKLYIQSRADTIKRNRNLLLPLKEIGLSWILTGFEAATDRQLERYRKNSTVKDLLDAIDILNSYSIAMQGMFVFGDRDDSLETYNELVNFCDSIADRVFFLFHPLVPFPGSSAFEDALQGGYLEITDFSLYDFENVILPSRYLTRKEIQKLLFSLKLRYTLRGVQKNLVRPLSGQEKLSTLINMGMDIFKKYSCRIFEAGKYREFKKKILEKQDSLIRNGTLKTAAQI